MFGQQLRGRARAEAILDAAHELIQNGGFPALSMAAVAQRARASKETIYKHFADRFGLLSALIDRETAKEVAELPAGPPGESVRGGLVRLGRWYLAVATSPRVLSLFRVLAAGAGAGDPAMARLFTARVNAAVRTPVESFLREQEAAGRARLPIPAGRAAEAFLGAVQGSLWSDALIGTEPADPQAMIEGRAADAAALILAGIGPPTGSLP